MYVFGSMRASKCPHTFWRLWDVQIRTGRLNKGNASQIERLSEQLNGQRQARSECQERNQIETFDCGADRLFSKRQSDEYEIGGKEEQRTQRAQKTMSTTTTATLKDNGRR